MEGTPLFQVGFVDGKGNLLTNYQ